jgi:hypothetical protein
MNDESVGRMWTAPHPCRHYHIAPRHHDCRLRPHPRQWITRSGIDVPGQSPLNAMPRCRLPTSIPPILRFSLPSNSTRPTFPLSLPSEWIPHTHARACRMVGFNNNPRAFKSRQCFHPLGLLQEGFTRRRCTRHGTASIGDSNILFPRPSGGNPARAVLARVWARAVLARGAAVAARGARAKTYARPRSSMASPRRVVEAHVALLLR